MITQIDDSQFNIQGNVTVDRVNNLWQKSLLLFAKASSICIDFTEAKQVDSAGAALLVAWTRWSQQQQKNMRFTHLPPQMQAILRVSGLEEILPIV